MPERERHAIRSRRAALPDGVRPATVVVEGERIEGVLAWDQVPEGMPLADLGETALLPGAVDAHVHVNEPGRTEWEGFASATRAAAAGGTTTIVDMPLNAIPPTVDPAGLEAKAAAAAGRCRVDVAFWGGVVPGNGDAVGPLLDAGARGLKAFLPDSGVPEFPPAGAADLFVAARALAARGLPLLVHAEDPEALARAAGALDRAPRAHAAWVASRPAGAEVAAVERMVRLARETGVRIHIVHVSAAEALAPIAAARAEGLPVTAETCPHYLTFDGDRVPDGDARYKCAPPIRSAANRERLWEALAGGTLDLVASDHSPCPPGLKAGDFVTAWGGIASLELLLRAVWTGARARGHGLADLARWTAAAPARLAGLADRKGRVAPGLDADLVAFEPDVEATVDPAALHHRHPVTAWEGERLAGRVARTWVRGRVAWDGREFPGPDRGALLGPPVEVAAR